MATGQLLCGRTNFPLYGRNGTLLFETGISMAVEITVSWVGGLDLDIDGHYNVVDGDVGYDHGEKIERDGFTAHWDGDDTGAGPERVHLAYTGRRSLSEVKFYIHANWYHEGSEGSCTVTATDAKGGCQSYTFSPSKSHGKPASRGDPGACINFNFDGSVKSITAG